MSAAVISPVIPPARFQASMRPAATPVGALLARPPLPLPGLIERHTSSAVYGLATLDDRGRLAERTVIRALSWPVRQRLALRETAGLLLLSAAADGVLEVTGQGHLRLPALLRHRYDLQAGDRLLLAADTRARRLIIYPPAALDALTAPHREAMGGALA